MRGLPGSIEANHAGYISKTGSVATFALLSVLVFAGPSAAQDWPMRGANPQRTALQPLGGDLSEPVEQYRIGLGGGVSGSKWILTDANLDGDVDVAVIRAGRVVLRSLDGRIYWASAGRDLRRIEAAADLDDDGRVELFASSPTEGLFALDGTTGEVLWSVRPRDNHTLGTVLSLDVDGDGGLELYLAECGVSSAFLGAGRVFSFRGGYASATQVSLDLAEHGSYWRCSGHASGDLDGDGLQEIVTLANDRVVAYSALSGQVRWTSAALAPFPYARGSVTVGDVDDDGRDEVVVASDNSFSSFAEAKRLLLLEVIGDALRVRASRVFDPVGGIHGFASRTIGSLSGAGAEVVTSHYDPVAGAWETLIFQGSSSDFSVPLLSLRNARVVGFSSAREDGRRDLIVVETEGARVPKFGQVRALRFDTDGTPSEAWRQESARVLEARSGFGSGGLVVADTPIGRRPVCLVDADADGRGESVVIAGTETRRELPRGVFGHAALRVPSLWGSGTLLSTTDGSIARLDEAFEVQNDTNPSDGRADLRETAFSPSEVLVQSGPEGVTLLSNAAGDTLLALRSDRPSASGELSVRWRATQTVARSEVPVFLGAAGDFVAYRSRGADDVLRLHAVRSVSGESIVDIEIGDSASSLGYHDLMPLQRSGAEPLVAFGLRDRGLNAVQYQVLDIPRAAVSELDIGRDLGGSGDRPASAFDWTADGVDDFFVVQRRTAVAASGQGGSAILRESVADFGGVLVFADLTPEPGVEVFHQATRQPRLLQPPGWTEVWAEERYDGGYLSSALVPLGAGGFAVAHARNGDSSLIIRRASDGVLLGEPFLAAGQRFASAAEAEAAGAAAAPLVGIIGVNDLVGASEGTFVVTSEDGHVYALDAGDGTLHWSTALRGLAGAPLAADVQGDGTSEVLVPVADGTIAVLAQAGLDAPDTVVDLESLSVSVEPSADIDEVYATDSLTGGWSEVPGADGYEYRILREDDLVVSEYQDVGLSTSFARQGLTLELGRSYRIAVRAYVLFENDRPVSLDAVSDGVLVTDTDPPTVSLEAAPSLFWRDRTGAAESTTLTAILTDSVGLSSVRLSVADESGERRVLADAPIGGTMQEFSQVWDGRDDRGDELPGGVYTATVTVTDRTGLMASASAAVTLCADEFAGQGVCAMAAPARVSLRAQPPVVAPLLSSAASYTDLILEVAEGTPLVRYRLDMFYPDGTSLITLADGPVAGRPERLVERWAGVTPSGIVVDAGVYEARAQVENDVGLRVSVSAQVTICRADQPSPEQCAEALMPWQVHGGGCTCAVPTAPGSDPTPWALFAVAMLACWRRGAARRSDHHRRGE